MNKVNAKASRKYFSRASMRVMYKLAAIMTITFPIACSTTTTASSDRLKVLAEHGLIAELGETSGLYCSQGKHYTIADSGNSPSLYAIDSQGTITNRVEVAKKNRDWESITGDDEYLYIGDFGNNAGKRNDLLIYKIRRSDLKQESKLTFSYNQYDIRKNEAYAHDYDAEAMVSVNDKLVLFSKSWLTNVVNIYHLDKSTTNQQLVPFKRLKGLPGVVTGADWDNVNQQFVLVGYNSNAFGITDPFIALLSEDYELQETFILKGFGQVEGLCVKPNSEIWITQENAPFSMAKLVKLQLAEGV